MNKNTVAEIKKDLVGGMGLTECAKKHDISRGAVYAIQTGKTHKDVPWPGLNVKPVDLTDQRLQLLEAENLHLREELTNKNKVIKSSRRDQGLRQVAVEELQNFKPMRPLPCQIKPSGKNKIKEHAVLVLSDGHHDQRVTPEECGGLEEYNFDISCARAENLVESTIDWTQHTLQNFEFQTLNIFSRGDSTSGEIHGAKDRSEYRNQIKNCLAIGQLHALMIRDLAPFFPQVNVVCLSGNHGRRSHQKDYHGAQDNWDYLIAEVARMHLRDIPNVNFTIPNSWAANITIDDVCFHLTHGDDVRGWNGVPFYGLVRRQRNLMALAPVQPGPPPRYITMGHHHVAGSLADVNGELLLNGAWVGTDSYAYNSFAGYREPCQLLHGVNSKYGVTWRMNVRLRSEKEKNGPQRYKVQI